MLRHEPDEYRAIAPIYDLILEPLLRPMRLALARRVAAWAPRRVLDLGCGTGRQVRRMLEHDQVWGLDVSSAMLSRAHRQAPGRCVRADATRAPFADASFDLVYCQLALHEKPRAVVEGVLAEARRLVSPEGRLLVADYAAPLARGPLTRTFGLGIRIVERIAGREHYRSYRDWMRRGGLREVLREQGWEPESAEERFFFGNLVLGSYRPAEASSAQEPA